MSDIPSSDLPATPSAATRPKARSSCHHPGFSRVFAPGCLTFGLIMPLETYPDRPTPTMTDHLAMARAVDEAGIAILWMRDVPFFDPRYGDAGQIFDPLIYIAALGQVTRSIALGTAGVVLPLREPKILAKQVASLDQLTGGRMLLGVSSGDRPSEYPLFGIDYDTRGERYRDAFEVYRTVIEQVHPAFVSERFGRSDGTLDMIPKPPFGHTPSLSIGRGQQSLAWIAGQMDGMIAGSSLLGRMAEQAAEWRDAVASEAGPEIFKPIGAGAFLDLVEDRDHPFERHRFGIRSGSRSLAAFFDEARAAGVHHIAFNPKLTRRPCAEVLEDLVRDVLPSFPAGLGVPATQ